MRKAMGKGTPKRYLKVTGSDPNVRTLSWWPMARSAWDETGHKDTY